MRASPSTRRRATPVFAGTLNGQGALEIEATRVFADNTLSKIVHLVEEAQEQKGRAQRFIERFGRRYSPALLAGGVLVAILPPLLGGDAREWFTRAITLIVAGAPCALVMSTPVAMAAGIGDGVNDAPALAQATVGIAMGTAGTDAARTWLDCQRERLAAVVAFARASSP